MAIESSITLVIVYMYLPYCISGTEDSNEKNWRLHFALCSITLDFLLLAYPEIIYFRDALLMEL
jgi:hypothetical protein